VKRTLVALALLAFSSLTMAGGEGLVVNSSSGQTIALNAEKQQQVKFWLQQLTLSALYRDVVQESNAAEWTQALQSGASIYCQYPANSLLAMPERQTLAFDAILLPVPDQGFPAYVFLKHGSKYKRVAKYDPWVLQKLEIEAGLLSQREPSVQRWLF